jgi:O-methyltransferase
MGIFWSVARKIYNNKALNPFLRSLNNRFNIHAPPQLDQLKDVTFLGWNMATTHALPWDDRYRWDTFRKTSESVKKEFEFNPDTGINPENIDDLKWRHWFLIFCLHFALEFEKIPKNDSKNPLNFVECGVADGITSYFLLNELDSVKGDVKYTLHLYDSWEPMREDQLVPSEFKNIGAYENSDLDRTKKNLSRFLENIVIHKGFIPESLTADPPSPTDSIAFMHIDLNSSSPTLAALEFFYPKMTTGGVIVFDDYGWKEYRETKEIIDTFFSSKPGILLKMPTGQGLFFVNR